MKPKTKRIIGNLFAALIKNDRAIDGAKTSPWWIGLILFVVGTFLPIIPIMTTTSKTYGASFLSSYTYGYETGLAATTLSLEAEHYSFEVNDNKTLDAKKDGVLIEHTWVEESDKLPKDEKPIASYNSVRLVNGNDVTEKAFEVYFSDRDYNKGTKTIVSLISAIEAKEYVKGTTNLYVPAEGVTKPETYTPSYVLIYSTGIYSKIYKTGTTTAVSSSYKGNNWASFPSGYELISKTVNVEGLDKAITNVAYVNGVVDNWKGVYNVAYTTQKQINFWFSSGLYYAIYLVLGLFMGLMIFLLTRGKHNPNRGLKLGTCMNISWWIDLTPGLLAMVLGFMFSQAAGIGYIVLLGMRTMWLSMRQLNPQTQA